ncbi:MAG: hypothetical protein MUE36_15275 [Acidimicrobiales bacterium]|nr:hypothetical protein [Acidimicrobiales bacterium]
MSDTEHSGVGGTSRILAHVRLRRHPGRRHDARAGPSPSATAAVFLAADASTYRTGGLLLADGGRGHLR